MVPERRSCINKKIQRAKSRGLRAESQNRANSPELRAKMVESIELSVRKKLRAKGLGLRTIRELIAESIEDRAGK